MVHDLGWIFILLELLIGRAQDVLGKRPEGANPEGRPLVVRALEVEHKRIVVWRLDRLDTVDVVTLGRGWQPLVANKLVGEGQILRRKWTLILPGDTATQRIGDPHPPVREEGDLSVVEAGDALSKTPDRGTGMYIRCDEAIRVDLGGREPPAGGRLIPEDGHGGHGRRDPNGKRLRRRRRLALPLGLLGRRLAGARQGPQYRRENEQGSRRANIGQTGDRHHVRACATSGSRNAGRACPFERTGLSGSSIVHS